MDRIFLAIFGISAIGIPVLILLPFWITRSGREGESAQQEAQADYEWSQEIKRIAETERMETTAEIDMTWLRTHLDMEDIEADFRQELNRFFANVYEQLGVSECVANVR